ncbi:MAG: hypothetical protein RLZZ511_2414 [Cyanobacteriota bacterium]
MQQQLDRLIIELAGTNLATKDGFETKHRGFGQGTPMIIGIAFPLFPPVFADIAPVFIPGMGWCFTVAMLLNHNIFVGWNYRLRLACRNRFIAMAMVIGPVRRNLLNRVLNPIEDIVQHRAIMDIVGADHADQDLPCGFMHT